MPSDSDHRAAIDRMTKRVRDSYVKDGRSITHDKARDKAVEIARRVDRKYAKR